MRFFMDYEKHFGLNDRPFKNNAGLGFFYKSSNAAKIISALKVPTALPIIHIKGEAKVGKTALLKALPPELRANFKVVVILNPQLTLAEILRQALNDLGHSHKFSQNTPEEELLGYFENAIIDIVENQSRLLLAIDNAEELPPEILADIYGLMALEAQWGEKISLILCGNPNIPWPVVPDNLASIQEF
ncbi:MAG: AAA family ATPase, partial [Candidatus Adiutrix sp.]